MQRRYTARLRFSDALGESRNILQDTLIQVQPPPATVHLTFAQLFGFLQNQASSANLQMICPLSGQPLPSIDLKLDSSVGKSARVEFSLRASEALIEYIRVSQELEVAD